MFLAWESLSQKYSAGVCPQQAGSRPLDGGSLTLPLILWRSRSRHLPELDSTESGDWMLGAIAGDIIGSVYEASPIKTTEFPSFDPGCRFTGDTALTVALADTLLSGGDYVDSLHEYFHLYPDAGYGGTFYR